MSPKGARLNAGRFNRPGTSTLYLALETDTALREYYKSDPPRPCVIVPAELEAHQLVDLTKPGGRWSKNWLDWDCDWESARDNLVAGNAAADCASWRCGDEAISRNFSGIVFPSRQRPGGTNVALFLEDAPAGSIDLKILDPLREILGAHPPIKRLRVSKP